MVYRSFGSDPAAVAAKVAAVVAGSRRTRLLSAAKHFPGHGRTPLDSHLALPEVELSFNDWLKTDALPFRAAVEAGVPLVMLGHLRFRHWDDAPTSLSKPTVDVLRDVLGFGGVVVTDDLGMAALAGLDPFAVVDQAIAAGVDLLLYATPTAPPEELIAHLRRRVEAGEVPLARLDESVRRVLRLKVDRFGL
jgi:beta-N-acetylhexosaminidase